MRISFQSSKQTTTKKHFNSLCSGGNFEFIFNHIYVHVGKPIAYIACRETISKFQTARANKTLQSDKKKKIKKNKFLLHEKR